MRTLFVVTHTESVHHVEGRVGGWYDTELTAEGRRDAEVVAECLMERVQGQNAEVFSSNLLRAAQTADAISTKLGVKTILMPALREMSYGVAEGQPQAWLNARQTPAPHGNRLDHRSGIENGETRRELASRIYGAVDEILARPCKTQIIVTHSFALTFVVTAWIKMPLESVGYVNFRVGPGSITHLQEDEFWMSRVVASLGERVALVRD